MEQAKNMRCPWCGEDPLYTAYHDEEWGVPERDPRALWELLMLEAFQAGLSWITILRKRQTFRSRFQDFDPIRLAQWGEAEIAAALADPGIVRHRGKIEATIAAARAWQRIEAQGGFAPFIWETVGNRPLQPRHASMAEVPATSPEATDLSKRLKAQGFRFCGPTITYAFMQAAGLVNDHLVTCHRHDPCAAMA